MPIFFNKLTVLDKPVEKPKPPSISMAELRSAAVSRVERKNESKQKDDSGVIKPKYLEDKSVFYKSSGYLKDLLGEGN